jgi:Fe(3+) dicitrate transport protein
VDLEPELSWNYELGVRSTVRPGLSVEATAFRMDFENQVISASLAGGQGATLTNAGETLHQGAEFLLQLESKPLLGTPYNAFLRTAYTWLPDAKFRGTRFSSIAGFGNVNVSGNRLPYAPKHLLSATAGLETQVGLALQIEAVFNDEVYTDDLNTVAVTPNGQRGLISSYTIWNTTGITSCPIPADILHRQERIDKTYVVDMTRGLTPRRGSRRIQLSLEAT